MTSNAPFNFEKFAQEGNLFLRELSEVLNHPAEEDRAQVVRLLKAVLHTLRDQFSVGQSLSLIAQFPMFLKAMYVDQWKYTPEKEERIKTPEEFHAAVEQRQREHGEVSFDWQQPTSELVKGVLIALSKYTAPGQFQDMAAELPEKIRHYLQEEVIGG